MKIWCFAAISVAVLGFAMARPEGQLAAKFLDEVREYLETQEADTYGEINFYSRYHSH